MKIIDIALKDLTRSMRSTFAVLFMFGVPLLVTGMFYFMFGNIASEDGGFNLPVTRVAIANLDEGSPDLQLGTSMLGLPAGQALSNVGEIVALILQNEAVADLVTVTLVKDAVTARGAVDDNTADAAIIIPPEFSSDFAIH